jgi:hypothetical protein
MSAQFKNLLFMVLIAAVLYGAYYAANVMDFFGPARTRAADVDAQTQQIQQEVLPQLAELNHIDLDPSLFSSPEFVSLTDITVLLPQPDVARPNPFAPY